MEAKAVEAIFRRYANVLHLHVAGQVIRTTDEHPFYAHGTGWTKAADLRAGDWVLTESGKWVPVEEVFDTQTWEVVYNLRVADHHTYFVGDDGWGFAVWAHNICELVIREELWSTGASQVINGHNVYGTAQVTSDSRHAAHIDAIVQQLAAQTQCPAGTYFVLNRSWRTALGRHLVPMQLEAARDKPDIIIVEPVDVARQNWKIHAVEVLSGMQTQGLALQNMNRCWGPIRKTLPNMIGSLQKGTFEAVAIGIFPNIQW